MIAAAQVIFRNSHGDRCLDWLSSELEKAGVPCSPTEWRGYGAVVPQLLVPTSPVSLTVQVDSDPEYVPAEIAEVASQARRVLPPHAAESLARCDTRLDIMSTTPSTTIQTEREIVQFAETDLDPIDPQVEAVLLHLSAITEGFVFDCVHGRIRWPAADGWVQL